MGIIEKIVEDHRRKSRKLKEIKKKFRSHKASSITIDSLKNELIYQKKYRSSLGAYDDEREWSICRGRIDMLEDLIRKITLDKGANR